eukprot:TRINITY_DN89077_c0_g1_i1.p2 TRINITY_DN89077_c0_g1~~TRINITY_DN89077_c0_g1_i1.p2  ORF type:complete len:179 (+),score=33.20 TRINITY_DN89077_c0_g1_i1:112-648(+)
MSEVAVLPKSSDIFSGDNDGLLSSLLDVQSRQQSCARQAYTGFGRQLQPFQFDSLQEEEGWCALEGDYNKANIENIDSRGVENSRNNNNSNRKQYGGRQKGGKKNGSVKQQYQKGGGVLRRRSNKKFSSLRQESAQAQELTMQNVTKLRGYVSDTGGSDVQSSFNSESSKNTQKKMAL